MIGKLEKLITEITNELNYNNDSLINLKKFNSFLSNVMV